MASWAGVMKYQGMRDIMMMGRRLSRGIAYGSSSLTMRAMKMQGPSRNYGYEFSKALSIGKRWAGVGTSMPGLQRAARYGMVGGAMYGGYRAQRRVRRGY